LIAHPGPAAAEPTDAAVRARADALVAEMTPDEKAAQLTTLSALPQIKGIGDQRARSGGGSVLFVSDPQETNRLQRIAIETSRLKIPLLFGFNLVHRLTTILSVPLVAIPSQNSAARSKSENISSPVGHKTIRRGRLAGVHDV
jgi:beta-glucosidase